MDDLKNQLYNSDSKLEFMSQYELLSTEFKQVKGLFIKLKRFEAKLNKDFYDFSMSEINDLMKAMRWKSYNTIYQDVRYLNAYLNWAIANGRTGNRTNRYISTKSENLTEYVYTNLNLMYSHEELMVGFNQATRIHRLIGKLMFYGIGIKYFEEIQELTIDNLHFIGDKFYIRMKHVEIEIPVELFEELVHFNLHGDEVVGLEPFEKSNKIFKPFKDVRSKGVINRSVRTRMCLEMKDIMDDNSFTIRTILRSGVHYTIYSLMLDNGIMELTSDIVKRVSTIYLGNSPYVSMNARKILNILNIKQFSEMYGDFTISNDIKLL